MKVNHGVTGGLDQPRRGHKLYANRGALEHIPARIISGLVMVNQTGRRSQIGESKIEMLGMNDTLDFGRCGRNDR